MCRSDARRYGHSSSPASACRPDRSGRARRTFEPLAVGGSGAGRPHHCRRGDIFPPQPPEHCERHSRWRGDGESRRAGGLTWRASDAGATNAAGVGHPGAIRHAGAVTHADTRAADTVTRANSRALDHPGGDPSPVTPTAAAATDAVAASGRSRGDRAPKVAPLRPASATSRPWIAAATAALA